jgi:carboxyl-terminal processing protease
VLRDDDSNVTMRMVRRRVDVPSVDGTRMVDQELGVAYLRLTSFQKTTSRDLDAALWQLHRQGMRSLILDLRGNPGGLLSASVEVADKFLANGAIVSTRGRSTGEDFDYRAHTSGTWRMPLVVLIDQDSASASEIFAGAIRDHRRGLLVGQRSYGKGSVQGIFPLQSSQAGVRLTTAKFYSPSGQPISRQGISPDLAVVAQTVARPADGLLAERDDDPMLRAALQAAREQFSQR